MNMHRDPEWVNRLGEHPVDTSPYREEARKRLASILKLIDADLDTLPEDRKEVVKAVKDVLLLIGMRLKAQRQYLNASALKNEKGRSAHWPMARHMIALIAGAGFGGNTRGANLTGPDDLLKDALMPQTPLRGKEPLYSPHFPLDLALESAKCLFNLDWKYAVKTAIDAKVKDPAANALVHRLYAGITLYYDAFAYSFTRDEHIRGEYRYAVVAMAKAIGIVDHALLDLGMQSIEHVEKRFNLGFSLLPKPPYPPNFAPTMDALLWFFTALYPLSGTDAVEMTIDDLPPEDRALFDEMQEHANRAAEIAEKLNRITEQRKNASPTLEIPEFPDRLTMPDFERLGGDEPQA
jgi:hypothetical protein